MTLFDPPTPPLPSGARARVRMTVAYHGRGYHGFAANPGVTTVGAVLAQGLERVLGHPVELACAGRTDAGVHARGQVVSFDARSDGLDLAGLVRAVNSLCGPSIAVRDAVVTGADFDARHSASGRLYRYAVRNAEVPDPFDATTAWHVPEPLDLAVLRLSCDPLIGEHDFASFCRRPKACAGVEPPSLVRRVRDARWEDGGAGVLLFWIEANAFCHQMVRSIVGTMVEIGKGQRRAGGRSAARPGATSTAGTAGTMAAVIRARDRRHAGNLAPPHGLCLWEVRYPN